MFRWRDNVIYDELLEKYPTTAVVKGQPQLVQNCFGFWLKNREVSDENVVFIYRCRQVRADKLIGTGEAIISGDRLYAVVNQAHFVTPNQPAGVAGVDYYFCGWAKRDAGASATEVIMNFDGTRYNEAWI